MASETLRTQPNRRAHALRTMVAYLRQGALKQFFIYLSITALGTLGAFAAVALAGSKRGAVLAAGCIFGPALIYAATVAPLAFPFLLYIFVVPFDNLTIVSSYGTLTKILGAASAAALLFYVIRTRRVNAPPKHMAAWFLLYMWMFATTFWAIDPGRSFSLLPTAMMLLGLYFIVSLVPLTYVDLRRIVLTIVAGFTLAAAYGFYLFHSGKAIAENGRLLLTQDTSQIDPNHFAAALLLPIALAMVCALRERRIVVKFVWLASLLVLLAGLSVSQSRGATLGLVVIVLFMFFRTPYRRQLLLVLGAMGVGAGMTFGHIATRFQNALSSGGAGRLDIWRVGFQAFKEHWLFGAGYYNFANAYDASYLTVFQKYVAHFHRAPHDLLVQTSVELGVIGVVLLLVAWFGQLGLLKHIGPDDPRFGLRVGAEAALLGLFVAAMFLDLLTMKYTWLTFMLVLLIRNATAGKGSNVADVSAVLPSMR